MQQPLITNIKDRCTACGACVNICPKGCIELKYDKDGFLMPELEIERCISCGLCEKSCHIFTTNEIKPLNECTGYAGWSEEEELRFKSSSGGFFSLLAKEVLENGGVVFGARYNYDLKRLEHCSTDQCDISALRKSKYIESNTLVTFKELENYLLDSRKVLYCGTPCQISGLKSYLSVKKRDVSNLLLVDFICHGVPSNLLYAQWLTYLENERNYGHIVSIDFRSKSRGWSPISTEYISRKGKKMNIPYYYDYSSLIFFDNRALRNACYKCNMINYHKSDITLADFWGRKETMPDDNKGISLMVVNTKTGSNHLNVIGSKNKIILKQLETKQFEYAYKSKDPKRFSLSKRNETYELINRIGYINTLKKLYGKQVFKRKVKDFIKKIIKWQTK